MGLRQALTPGERSGWLEFQGTVAEVQAERRVCGEYSGQAWPCSAPGFSHPAETRGSSLPFLPDRAVGEKR